MGKIFSPDIDLIKRVSLPPDDEGGFEYKFFDTLVMEANNFLNHDKSLPVELIESLSKSLPESIHLLDLNLLIEFISLIITRPSLTSHRFINFVIESTKPRLNDIYELLSDPKKISLRDKIAVTNILYTHAFPYGREERSFSNIKSECRKSLTSYESKEDSYFMKRFISHRLDPKDFFSFEDKKQIIKLNWDYLIDPDGGGFNSVLGPAFGIWSERDLDGITVESFGENMIDSLWPYLKDLHPGYLYWCQQQVLKNHYHEPSLSNKPFLPETRSNEKFCYSSLSDRYGVVFSGDLGMIDRFFEKNNPEKVLRLEDLFVMEGYTHSQMDESSYKDLLESYRVLISLSFRAGIENDFGFDLSSLSLREQLQFLRYISDKDKSSIDRLRAFVSDGVLESQSAEINSRDRLNRIRSFFSLENDPDFGDVIISIGEGFNSRDASIIYNQYADLVRVTQEAVNKLMALFPDVSMTDDVLNNVAQNLLSRSTDFLRGFDSKLHYWQDGNSSHGKMSLDDSMIRKLKKYKADILLTISFYNELKKNPDRKNITFEQLNGVEFQEITMRDYVDDGVLGSLITDERFVSLVKRLLGSDWKSLLRIKVPEGKKDRSLVVNNTELDGRVDEIMQILEIYEENYSHLKDLQKKIVVGFIECLYERSSGTSLFVTRQVGEVLAFCRMVENYDDTGANYFGSMNVAKAFRGNKIGGSFMDAVLKDRRKGAKIDADCVPTEAVSSLYVEKYDFIMTKMLPGYSGNDMLVEIKRRAKNSQSRWRSGVDFSDTKSVSDSCQKIIVEARSRNNEFDYDEGSFVLMFNNPPLPSELEIMREIMNDNGYLCTRYFVGKPETGRGRGRTYAAFERFSLE